MIKFTKNFENLLTVMSSDSLFERTCGIDDATVALNYRYFSLMSQKEKDEISSLENKIANKKGNYRKDEIESFKVTLGIKKGNLERFETQAEEYWEGYEKYLALFSENDTRAVRLILGIMSAQYTPKLWDYVADEFATSFVDVVGSLFGCMEYIHKPSIDNLDNLSELGVMKISSVDKMLKEVKGVLQDTLFNTFSIKGDKEGCPWVKMNLRFNATHLHMIHESYIRDLKDTSRVKDGEVYNGRAELISSIKMTVKKDGTVEYNCTKFCKSLLILVKDMIIEKVNNK